tara:strand:- start:200 stop:352 length:153 start_codon:yes stop_codon:yes gene_type:complete
MTFLFSNKEIIIIILGAIITGAYYCHKYKKDDDSFNRRYSEQEARKKWLK